MKHALTILRGLCAVLVAAYVVPAVGVSGGGNVQDNRQTVYILEVKQEGKSTLHGDLSDFTVELLELRLAELKSFKAKADAAPKCGEGQKEDARGLTQVTLASEADFYALRASIQVRTPEKAETEVVLDYELTKCVRGETVSLTRSKEPFAESEVLKYLNSMADVVSLLLEKERAVTKAVADAYTVGDNYELAGKVNEAVKAGLKQATDFDLPEKGGAGGQPDFTIRGEVFVSNKVLNYRVRIATKDGRTYPPQTIKGPDADKQTGQKLDKFFKAAADAALAYLKNVRYVAEPKRNIPLSEEESAQMLDRARRWMCVGAGASEDCKHQPENAILILTEVKERKKTTDHELLGKAQMLVGEYFDAAQSFDYARSLVADTNPEAVINLLNQSGEAWFKAKNYDTAAARYEESLKLYAINRGKLSASLLREEPGVQLQKARSYRYGNKGVEALKIILDSWDARHDPKDLREELGYLLEDLPENRLTEAGKVLEGYKGQPQYEVAKAMLENRMAMESLTETLIFYGLRGLESEDKQGEIFEEIDKQLKNVEAMPAASLSADARVLQQTLRALWYRDYKKDFARAIPLLEQASAGKSELAGALSRVFLADTYYQKAQQPETPDPETFYEKASSLLKDSTREGNSGAYMLLVAVNHKLGKDKETRELLEERGKEDKEGYDAFKALSTVCTHYLSDLECGLKNAELMRSVGGVGTSGEAAGTLAEVQLFRGQYTEAQEEFARTNNPTPLDLFYRTWTLFALDKETEASASARQWKTDMEELRKAGAPINLILEGARRALDKETHLTPARKELLRAMLSAMTDKSIPLPPLP